MGGVSLQGDSPTSGKKGNRRVEEQLRESREKSKILKGHFKTSAPAENKADQNPRPETTTSLMGPIKEPQP